MAPVSNDRLCMAPGIDRLNRPGETESSNAEVQLDKGYPGRRCANGVTGPRRTCVRRGLFL